MGRYKNSKLTITKNAYLKLYKSWDKVRCPELDADVRFTGLGWDHIAKEKGRTANEQIARYMLLPLAKKLIETHTGGCYKRQQNGYLHIEISGNIGGTKLEVIIRKMGDEYFYYSVFKK